MSKLNKVIIIGGKGAAVVVGEQIYDAQIKTGQVEFLGYAFDDESFGDNINGFPILAKTYEVFKKYEHFNDVGFIFQLYRPDLINERVELLNSYGIPLTRYFSFIHPNSMVAKSVKVGVGCSILSGTTINANSIIGNHCTFNSSCLVGHDAKIADYNFFAAHAVIGSNIKMGNKNFVGLNTTFNNYLEIGDNNFIAMGANVIKSIGSNFKLKGNPAKSFDSSIKPL